MATLAKTLADVRQRIAQASKRGLNEQNTKATLIDPVLRALGWDTENIEEVVHEYRVKRRDKPVDYGLLTMRTPRLFVEAKGLGEDLRDRRWTNQIMGYAAVAGVKWIVLTDGNEYRIYNAHAPVHVDEKLFRSVRVDRDDAALRETLELLAKDQLVDNRIEDLWRAEFVDRRVHETLERLFSDEGDLLLVNYVVGKTENLSPEEVRASLQRCRASFDFPNLPPGRKGGATPPPPPPAPLQVTLVDLIQAGLIHPPTSLERKYKGEILKARIEHDGRVTFGGEAHNSLSLAGAAARASVIGKKTGGKLPSTNGWTFWLTKDGSGKQVPLDELRQKYLASRAAEEAG